MQLRGDFCLVDKTKAKVMAIFVMLTRFIHRSGHTCDNKCIQVTEGCDSTTHTCNVDISSDNDLFFVK